MLDSELIQQSTAKAVLIVLIILQIALIAFSYSFKFDDYISLVVIILGLIISYFAFHYLRHQRREVRGYQAIFNRTKPEEVEDFTKTYVDKLLDDPEFKKHKIKMQAKAKMGQPEQLPEELEGENVEKKNEDETEAFLQELKEMEDKIFDL